MHTRINNFTMHYDVQGKDMPLLLIHGYPLNRKMWEPQVSWLSNIACVITPDLRGHGESEPAPATSGEPDAYSMDLHASDCAALLDALGITQPVVVAGLSMGGYIALAFHRKYPQKVSGLILTATRAGSDSPEAKVNRSKAIDLARHSGVEAIVESMLPKLLAPKTYSARPDLPESLASIMRAITLEAVVGDLLGMRDRPDSIPLLPNIDRPTLLIHGADDQIINLEDMKVMEAAIPSSRLYIIPEAGHLVNLEQPAVFNQIVAEYLQEIA